LLQALAVGDGKALLELSNALATASAPFGAILDELAAIAYRLSVAHFAGGLDADDPDQAALQNLQGAFGAEDLQLIYQIAPTPVLNCIWPQRNTLGFPWRWCACWRLSRVGRAQSLVLHPWLQQP